MVGSHSRISSVFLRPSQTGLRPSASCLPANHTSPSWRWLIAKALDLCFAGQESSRGVRRKRVPSVRAIPLASPMMTMPRLHVETRESTLVVLDVASFYIHATDKLIEGLLQLLPLGVQFMRKSTVTSFGISSSSATT
jgi:hypothetical protein